MRAFFKKETWLAPKKGESVTVPYLVLLRMRVLLVGSLLLNGGLTWVWMHALSQQRLEWALIEEATRLAQTSRELAECYAVQIETLAHAYVLYGASLRSQDPAERKKNYRGYTRRLQDFNQGAQNMMHLRHTIRHRLNRIRLLDPKEAP